MIEPILVLAILFAAALHATWNALVKSGGDRLIVLAAVNLVGFIIGGVGIHLLPLPAPASWPYLALSAVLHTGYYAVLLKAYRHGDLSHVYPLARGSAPLWITLGAALFLGEVLPPTAIVGISLACGGIMYLSFEGGPPWAGNRPATTYAFVTGAFIAAYSLADGMGVRLAESAPSFILWLSFLDGWPIALFAIITRRGQFAAYLSREWRYCLGGGVSAMVAYGLVIYAMSASALGAVSALRETSVIMAALIGVFFLRERASRFRVVAAGFVCLGVITLNLA